MTSDELKSLPKGDFIVMKTGVHPMRVHLKLFFKWGIEFDDEHPYTVPENGNRKVEYAEKIEIQNGIMEKYHPEGVLEQAMPSSKKSGGQNHTESEKNELAKRKKERKGGGKGIKTTAPINRLDDAQIIAQEQVQAKEANGGQT